ncbi:MAG: hypothetical protein AAGF01_05075 [Cyanobacteria bacterium P01_G01_bin.38]
MTHTKRNSLSIYALEKQISQNLSEENLKEIRGSGGGSPCPDCRPVMWSSFIARTPR